MAAALLLLPTAAHAKLRGAFSVSLGPGLDTNPGRIVGGDSRADPLLAATGSAHGRLRLGADHRLSARYDLGLKKFLSETDEDVAVQQLGLDYATRLGPLAVGFDGSGKLRLSRGGSRDYRDAAGDAFVEWSLSHALATRLSAGVRWFSYPPDSSYSSFGPRASLALRYQPWRKLGLSLAVSGTLPDYEGTARRPDGELSAEPRRDRQLAAQLQASFRGPVLAQASYLWSGTWSNSFGESTRRHRIAAALTARLPLSFFASAQVAWQAIHYPEGLFLSKELLDLLLYDDESQSSLSLKLARPITKVLEIEAKYAVYWVALPAKGEDPALDYVRQLATLGLAARW
ncbi:MAG: hypothetical protein ACOX6T_10485 [Myxococcales bacterium]|jgi:hypothetical protein